MKIIWIKYLYPKGNWTFQYIEKIEVVLFDFHPNKKDEIEITEFWENATFFYIRNLKECSTRNWKCKPYKGLKFKGSFICQ